MPTTVSLDNISKSTPKWFRKLKRIVNVGLVPVAVTTIKGLWHGAEAHLNEILLIITITLPGVMELIGMVISDEPSDD